MFGVIMEILSDIGGSLRKTWKFHTFHQLSCMFGEDLYLIQLLRKKFMCVRSAAGELGGPFNKPDLILTVVDGQKPKCVRVATVPDLS